MYTSDEFIGNGSTRILTGGDQTVDEYYADKKADKKVWTVVYVEGEMHYAYVGDNPTDVVEEDEPAFVPLNEEASPLNNGIKRKMNVAWDGAASSA